VISIAPEAMSALLTHSWPGNVRELQNVITYAFAVGRSPELGLDDLPPELRGRELGASKPSVIGRAIDDSTERRELVEALYRAGGDLASAAARLGISRTTLWRRRMRYGV